MNVGILSYYEISLITESEGKFRRENGNRRWLEFYKYLASQNSQIELYKSKNHQNPLKRGPGGSVWVETLSK